MKLYKVSSQHPYTLKEKRKGLFHTQVHLPPKEVGKPSGVWYLGSHTSFTFPGL